MAHMFSLNCIALGENSFWWKGKISERTFSVRAN